MDAPVRIASIHLAGRVPLAHDLLDLESIQTSLPEATLSMIGPDDALDYHALLKA